LVHVNKEEMEGDVDNHIRLYSPPAGVWGMKAGEKERRSFWGGGL